MWNVRRPGLALALILVISVSGCQLKLARDTSGLASATGSTAPLSVVSVSPSDGPITGNTTITITGTGFVSGATVTVGSGSCASVSFVSATQLTCVTPAHAAGWQTLTVTNPGGQSASLPSAFAFNAPSVPVGASFIVSAGGISSSSAGIGITAVESVGVTLDPIHQTSVDVQNLYGPQGVLTDL